MSAFGAESVFVMSSRAVVLNFEYGWKKADLQTTLGVVFFTAGRARGGRRGAGSGKQEDGRYGVEVTVGKSGAQGVLERT